ncbi:MAG: WecB/TagA/CpsF family glycosyltransferase [Candidatus Hydrogenedentes bacterium]|nr:WecB/TagA/CpsF family glycosyltransferase [Candidatus Hydrogenedentota bacterium]
MSNSPSHGPGTPRCAQRGLETVTLFNMPMNNLNLQETLEAIGRHVDANEQGFVVTPNVDHAVEFDENPDFRQAYYDAAMVLVDGMYLVWAGRLFGKPIKAKISGSDLIYWLSEYAAEKGYSIYLLGAKEGVAEMAGKKLAEKYPGLKVAGSYSPPLGFEKNPVENQKAIDLVRESGADICFVALGAPKQDLWSWRHHKEAGAKLFLGVGASFDFVAGTIQRAPVWMQNLGLEWVWRILQEPSRMAHRYLIRDSKFLLLLWREWKSEW